MMRTAQTMSQGRQADVLLITAEIFETKAFLKLFPGYERLYQGNKTYYKLGEVEGAQIFLVQSEVGSSGAGGSTLTVANAIRELSPSAMIMAGAASGIDARKQRVGQILIAERLLDYEPQRIGEQVAYRRGERVATSVRLLDKFKGGAIEWQEETRVEFGLLLSGSKIIANRQYRDQLLSDEPEAIGCERGGAGVYAAAMGDKVDWIVVTAISDWTDGRSKVQKVQDQELAAKNVAHFVLHVLQLGGFQTSSRPSSPRPVSPQNVVVERANSPEAAQLLKKKQEADDYDLFLACNDKDKEAVKEIALDLKAQGILPWFYEWDAIPGLPWQRQIEQQLVKIPSAAVFVGPNGMGPWHQTEVDVLLQELHRRGCPVVPVLLPNAIKRERPPLFLSTMKWIDFNQEDPDPLSQLILTVSVGRKIADERK